MSTFFLHQINLGGVPTPHSPGFLRSPGSVPVEPFPQSSDSCRPSCLWDQNPAGVVPSPRLPASVAHFCRSCTLSHAHRAFSERPNPAGSAVRPPPASTPDSPCDADTKELSVQLRLCISQPGPQPQAPVRKGNVVLGSHEGGMPRSWGTDKVPSWMARVRTATRWAHTISWPSADPIPPSGDGAEAQAWLESVVGGPLPRGCDALDDISGS